VKYGKFDMIYIGKYPDEIPYKVKHDRRARLNTLLKETSLENNQQEIGNIKTVLINETLKSAKAENTATISGYTEDMKQIILKPKKAKYKAGEFVTAKVTKGVPFKLYGDII
jgi:tRNA A37 methylthiotransferase MiaB